MKNSLKEQLNFLIRVRGEVSYNEIKVMCENGKFGKYYRIETADRRLRKSESPNVEPIMEKGYIIAWKYIGEPIKMETFYIKDPMTGQVEGTIQRPLNI